MVTTFSSSLRKCSIRGELLTRIINDIRSTRIFLAFTMTLVVLTMRSFQTTSMELAWKLLFDITD